VLALHDLPALNASLNATTAVLLTTGYVLIRRGHRVAHRAVMLAALCVSAAFLVSYLYYHSRVGTTHFPGQGWIRALYFAILLSHTFLAAGVVPLALVTLRRGLRADHPRHARLARWTLPIWLYVSVTGVVIYAMLYRVSW
jgi:putative membrane protein